MSELISGKDALIALANGEDVEYMSINGWSDVKHLPAYEFLGAGYEFRLKPRTITLNGVELPKPLTAVFNTTHKTSVELDFATEQDAINFSKMFSNEFIECV